MPTTRSLTDQEWKRIMRYLRNEQAAILLGPEANLLGDYSLQEAVHSHIQQEFKGEINYFYQQDGLYLFPDNIIKNEVAQEVREFLESNSPAARSPFERRYKQLAELRFPLYVSIHPDTYLDDVCYRYGVPHSFHHFRRNAQDAGSTDERLREIEPPTADRPLLYNLCGSQNDDESLILDYEDLFGLIAHATNSNGLPDKLRVALSRIRLFIFVGFSFEKWYTQLLLRIVCGSTATQKYAIQRTELQEPTRDFLFHQFQVEFLPEGSFFDQLYHKCQEEGLLRTLPDPLEDSKVSVIREVQQGIIDAALKKLQKLAAGQDQAANNEAIMLQARFAEWQQNKRSAQADSRDLIVEYNRIVDALLQLLQRL